MILGHPISTGSDSPHLINTGALARWECVLMQVGTVKNYLSLSRFRRKIPREAFGLRPACWRFLNPSKAGASSPAPYTHL
jgi:hypothetical protein